MSPAIGDYLLFLACVALTTLVACGLVCCVAVVFRFIDDVQTASGRKGGL